jgi:hypothetical protein
MAQINEDFQNMSLSDSKSESFFIVPEPTHAPAGYSMDLSTIHGHLVPYLPLSSKEDSSVAKDPFFTVEIPSAPG